MEDILLSKIANERDVDGAKIIKDEDIDGIQYYLQKWERKLKYNIVYLENVIERDFLNLPATIRLIVKMQ